MVKYDVREIFVINHGNLILNMKYGKILSSYSSTSLGKLVIN